MSKRKQLLIRGEFRDLGDFLKVARIEGRKALGVRRVNVKLPITADGNNGYFVTVEAMEVRMLNAWQRLLRDNRA
jgi:hypothetical protein